MVEKRLYIRQFILSEYLKGHNAYDAKENICNHIHPNAVSQSTVTHWFRRFKRGDFNLEDRPRPDRIPTAEINRLRELVEADHSRSIRSLANELGISHTSVKRHLKNFGIEHDSGFWVYPIRIEDLAQNSASTQEIRYPYNLPPPSTHSNYDWNLGWYSESSHQNY